MMDKAQFLSECTNRLQHITEMKSLLDCVIRTGIYKSYVIFFQSSISYSTLYLTSFVWLTEQVTPSLQWLQDAHFYLIPIVRRSFGWSVTQKSGFILASVLKTYLRVIILGLI